MVSLKTLRTRIRTVQETQKITTAMMLVSGSKLRKAETHYEEAVVFIKGFETLLKDVSKLEQSDTMGVKLLTPPKENAHHLIIVMTSDRGLCGAFNAVIIREVKNHLRGLEEQGKTFSILPWGRKGRDLLRGSWGGYFLKEEMVLNTENNPFKKAKFLKDHIMDLYKRDIFDVCTFFYSQFYSIMSQVPQKEQLIPISFLPREEREPLQLLREFEPDPSLFLESFLEMYLSTRVMHGMLQTDWSEQGARMMAMDGATRNAKEMTQSLQLLYNRSRQATITKELIEIISGSEAL